jgi:hypothetical protein
MQETKRALDILFQPSDGMFFHMMDDGQIGFIVELRDVEVGNVHTTFTLEEINGIVIEAAKRYREKAHGKSER